MSSTKNDYGFSCQTLEVYDFYWDKFKDGLLVAVCLFISIFLFLHPALMCLPLMSPGLFTLLVRGWGSIIPAFSCNPFRPVILTFTWDSDQKRKEKDINYI